MSSDESLIKRLKHSQEQYRNLPDDAVAEDLYQRLGEPKGVDRTTFYKDVLGESEPGFAKEFAKSFSRSNKEIANLATTLGPAAALSGVDKFLENNTGIDMPVEDTVRKLSKKGIERMRALQKERPQLIQNRRDVEDVGDLGQYVGALAGQGLGSTLSTLIPGIMTGGGAAVGNMALRSGLKNAAKKFGKELSESAVDKQLKKGAFGKVFNRGVAAGTLGSSTSAETGSTYMDLLRQEKDAPGVAITAGSIKGALEVLPEFLAAKRLFKTPNAQNAFSDAVTNSVFKKFGINVFRETTKVGAAEALTEAAQESVDIAADDFVNERSTDLFRPDNVDRLIEAGLAGFIGAGPVGVVTGAAQTAKPDTGFEVDSRPEFSHEAITEEVISEDTPTDDIKGAVSLSETTNTALSELDTLKNKGLIDDKNYQKQRKEILSRNINGILQDSFQDATVDADFDLTPKQLQEGTLDTINYNKDRAEQFNVKLDDIISTVRQEKDQNLAPIVNSDLVIREVQRVREDAPTQFIGEDFRSLADIAQENPNIVVPGAVEPTAQPEKIKLPSNLSKAQPKYFKPRGEGEVKLNFKNDLAKALYIVGKDSGKDKSKRHQEYVNWLNSAGIDNPDVFGRQMRRDIKKQVDEGNDTVDVDIPANLKSRLPLLTQPKKVSTQRDMTPVYTEPRLMNRDPALYEESVQNLRMQKVLDPQNLGPVAQKIQDRIQKITGPQVDVRFFNDISELTTDGNLANPVRGAQWQNVIAVAFDFNTVNGYSNNETAFHEAFHFLWNNTLTDSDKAVLENNRDRLREFVSKETGLTNFDLEMFQDTEEVSATAFGLWADKYLGNKSTPKLGPVQKVFKKIARILRDIRDTLKRNKVQKFEDLFESVAAGQKAAQSMRDIVSSDRVARLQRAVYTSRKKLEDVFVDTPMRSLITEEKFKDMTGQEAPIEWTTLQNVTARTFNTAPGLATKDPVWSTIWNTLYSQQQNLNVLDNIIVQQLEDVFHSPKRLTNASGILDYLNSNDMPIKTDSNGQVVYSKDNKLLRLDKQTSEDVIAASTGFKTIMQMWKGTALEKLKEIDGFDSITAAIQAQEDIVSDLEAAPAGAYESSTISKAKKRLADLEATQETIEFIDKTIKSPVPYFPRIAVGEYGMKITRKDDPRADVEQGFAMVRSDLNGKPNRKEIESIKKRWENELGYDLSEYNISEPFKLNRNNLVSALNQNSMEYNIEILASLMASNNPDLVNEITQAADALGGEQAKVKIEKHFLERNDTLLYLKDYASVLPAYFSSATRSVNRYRYAEVNDAISRMIDNGFIHTNKGQINLTAEQQELYRKQFKYFTEASNDWRMTRLFNFTWAMGMNFSSAALQLVTLNTMVVGAMNTYGGNPISNNAIVMKNFSTVSKMMAASGFNIDKFGDPEFVNKYIKDPKMAQAVREAHDRGEFRPGRAEDMMGADVYGSGTVQSDGFASPASRLVGGNVSRTVRNGIGKPVQVAEETSRITAFMSFYESLQRPDAVRAFEQEYAQGNQRYRVFKDINGDIDPAQVASLFLVDDTHGVFGKIGRGPNQQGPFGALLFPFMQHPLMMMGLLGRMVSGGAASKAGAFYIITSIMALAGLYGIPGWELWKELYESGNRAITGKDIDLHHELKRAAVTSNFMSPDVAEAFTEGAVKPFAGIDIGRRISIPFFFQDALIPLLQGKGNIDEFTGVAGSVVRTGLQNYNRFRTGETEISNAILDTIAPISFRNAYKATVTYPDEGVRTARGTQIMTPDELTPANLLAKGFGFQPSQNSREYEKRNAERLGKYGWQTGKQRLVNRISNKMLQRRNATTDTEIQEINAELEDLYTQLIEFVISANKVPDGDFWRGVRKSIKNHLINAEAPDAVLENWETVEHNVLYLLYERE